MMDSKLTGSGDSSFGEARMVIPFSEAKARGMNGPHVSFGRDDEELAALLHEVGKEEGSKILLEGFPELEALVAKAKDDSLSTREKFKINQEIIADLKTEPSLLKAVMEKGKRILAKAGLAGGLLVGTAAGTLVNHYNTEALNQDLALMQDASDARASGENATEPTGLRFESAFNTKLHRDKIDPALCILLGLGIAGLGAYAQEASKESA